MRNLLIILTLCFAISSSCTRLPDIQGTGSPTVQGVWEQQDLDTALETYTKHKFKFSCDSFYLEMEIKNKLHYFADTCSNDGKRIEYAKGIYVLKEDSLFLNGVYTKENYKQKISGCFNIGSYRHNFLVLGIADGNMNIRDLSNNVEGKLLRTATFECVPQPL